MKATYFSYMYGNLSGNWNHFQPDLFCPETGKCFELYSMVGDQCMV